MKHSWKIALLSAGFIVGVLYGVSSGNVPPPTQQVAATTQLEEQLQRYEQTIAEGDEFRPSYSEQVTEPLGGGHNQIMQNMQPVNENPNQLANNSSIPSENAHQMPSNNQTNYLNYENRLADAPQIQNQNNVVGHNVVSQFGHGMGQFLKTVVRESLRALVIFFDYLITV